MLRQSKYIMCFGFYVGLAEYNVGLLLDFITLLNLKLSKNVGEGLVPSRKHLYYNR